MPTSYVEYGKFGFWTRDSYLSSWFMAVVEELRKRPELEKWQASLAEHWLEQIEIDGGVMNAALDKFLTDGARRDFVVAVCEVALKECGPVAKRTGELFIALLLGNLRTTVSSPIDYLDRPGES